MLDLLLLLASLVLGILAGTITGLTPGLHINLVAVLAVAVYPLFPSIDPFLIMLFIVAMGITHSFLDFIPSTFIGVPSTDTALSVLPAHRMLLKGDAQKAIYLTLLGSLGSFSLCVLFLPVFLFIFPFVAGMLKGRMGITLFFLILLLLLLDSRTTPLSSLLIVFLLSGFLGYAALNGKLVEPLFPLLSGLFGVSIILSALKEKSRIPPQRECSFLELLRTHRKRSHLLSLAAGSLTGFLPGLGSSHASVLANAIASGSAENNTNTTAGGSGDGDEDEDFLVVQGGINTVNFFVSLVTLFSIGKARNGALLAAQKIVPSFNFSALPSPPAR